MGYMLTHQKTDLSQILFKGWPVRNPKQTLPQHKRSSLNGRQTSEPIGKNAQIALSAHKWEGCPGAHRWTYPALELVSLSQTHVSFLPTKSESWQPVPSMGETGRIPETNGFGSCWERPLKSPSGLASHKQLARRGLSVFAVAGGSTQGGPGKPDAARAQPHRQAPKSLTESRSGCSPLESQFSRDRCW